MRHRARLDSSWVESDGMRIHARVGAPGAGRDGPTVVLVHGLLSSRYLVPTLERLAGWCRALAPDLPGFGRSPRRPMPPTVPRLAEALGAWMTAAALPPAVVVGHSNGAQVAAELAARHPERVEELVLASPTGDPCAGFPTYAGRWWRNLPREPLSLNLVIAREVFDAGFRPTHAFLRALRHRFVDVLPRIGVPTLVLRGEQEAISPASWTARVAALVPGARLAEVPGAAHTYVWAAPTPFDDTLRAHLLAEGPGSLSAG